MRFPTVTLATAVFAANAFAATPTIGVAAALGTYSVDGAAVTGNSNLSDGTALQTAGTPSDIHLQNGVDVRLATRSAGTLFVDHAVLQEGAVRVGNFSGYTVNARQLQIEGETPGAKAVIRLNKKTVEVASIGGDVKVMDGGMLTRVAAGTKTSFQQTGGSPGQTQASTGAAPAPKGPSDSKTVVLAIGITAVAALAVGLTAAVQGKNPF